MPAQADSRIESASILVKEMADAVKIAVEADYASDEARITAVDGLIDTYFDFQGIIRFSAAAIGKKATEEERETYSVLFRSPNWPCRSSI